jgi:hypothetical protein
MNNIVVNIKYGGYLVKFPYRDDLNFFANNEESLIEGLDNFKIIYTPQVFFIIGSYSNFKLKKIPKKQLELYRQNIEALKKFHNK